MTQAVPSVAGNMIHVRVSNCPARAGGAALGHVLHISDDTFHIMQTMAAERGQSPEELLDTLVDEAWEQECAKYDAAFQNDPDWQEAARKAEAGLNAHGPIYPSTEAFFRHLGASEEELEAARRLDQTDDTDADADA
jgi:hypothetical protein